jgi:hypothetical protein
MKFCFKCTDCGATFESQARDVPAHFATHKVIRDYRAESVGLGSGVKVSRDGTVADQKKLFLPDNDEFKGPGDPDGKKGMRDWHERFAPRADNPSPVNVGEIEKKVF